MQVLSSWISTDAFSALAPRCTIMTSWLMYYWVALSSSCLALHAYSFTNIISTQSLVTVYPGCIFLKIVEPWHNPFTMEEKWLAYAMFGWCRNLCLVLIDSFLVISFQMLVWLFETLSYYWNYMQVFLNNIRFEQWCHILENNLANLPLKAPAYLKHLSFELECQSSQALIKVTVNLVVNRGIGSWPKDMLHGPLQTVCCPSCGLSTHLVCTHNQSMHMAKRKKYLCISCRHQNVL